MRSHFRTDKHCRSIKVT